jgi:gamma-glutamylcyclotransferase (GGCT)/AIG2-like uncharacterized protein YtfP
MRHKETAKLQAAQKAVQNLNSSKVERNERKHLYFGYGSNMWKDQMRRRCPESAYIGVGLVQGWKWIINTMGYGNIIPSEGDIVYGLLYEMTESDLERLDSYEGVPYAYTRQLEDIVVCKDLEGLRKRKEYDAEKRILHSTIVYVDKQRLSEYPPKTEYIHRMNLAIKDAVEEGVPQDYIDKYLRKFIPQVPPQ